MDFLIYNPWEPIIDAVISLVVVVIGTLIAMKIWEWYKRPKLVFNPVQKFIKIDRKKLIGVESHQIFIKNKGSSDVKSCKLEIRLKGEGEVPLDALEPFDGRCRVNIEGKLSKPKQINRGEEVSFEILRETFKIVITKNGEILYPPEEPQIEFPSETGFIPIRWFNEKGEEDTATSINETTFLHSINWEESVIILTSQNTKEITKNVNIEKKEIGWEIKIV